MKWTAIGTMAGIVAGFMVKRWMDEEVMEEQEQIIALYEELLTNTPVDDDQVTRKHPPPSAVWICEFCHALMMFENSTDNMKSYIEQLKQCDGIECPVCHELNMIDDYTRDVLEWEEEHK